MRMTADDQIDPLIDKKVSQRALRRVLKQMILITPMHGYCDNLRTRISERGYVFSDLSPVDIIHHGVTAHSDTICAVCVIEKSYADPGNIPDKCRQRIACRSIMVGPDMFYTGRIEAVDGRVHPTVATVESVIVGSQHQVETCITKSPGK